MVVVSDEYEDGDNLPGDNLRVTVHLRMIKQLGGPLATTSSVSLYMPENTKYTIRAGDEPNRDNVEVIILSEYAGAWLEYFEYVKRDINRRYGANTAAVDSNLDEGEVTLTILGKGGAEDILYSEKVTEYQLLA